VATFLPCIDDARAYAAPRHPIRGRRFAILFLLVAPLSFAQTTQDALLLLHQVAENARNLKTYRAAGHITEDLDLGLVAGKWNLDFKIAVRRPGQMRMEENGGMEDFGTQRTLAVCDGETGWVYHADRNEYEQVLPQGDLRGFCTASTLSGFDHVDEGIKSAAIAGRDHSEFEGRSQSCVVVKAQYRAIDQLMILPGMVMRIGRVSRTMCIEPTRKLILRDFLDADLDATGPEDNHIAETITYQRIETDPALAAALFEFHAPEGAKLHKEPEPPAAKPVTEPTPSALLHVFAPPEPVFKTEPEYSQEAWDEGIQGKIVITGEVDADGAAHEFKVQESLGWGLDEKALECVRKWRFQPATEDAKPVKGNAYITLDFVLPDKRPERPSAGPISRPSQRARLPVSDLQMPTDLDNFFDIIANAFKAPDLCERIHPLANGGGGGFNPRGLEVERLQSSCYYNVAIELHDPSLCEHVKPVRIEGMDGSRFDAAYCRDHLFAPTSVIPDPHRMGPFVHFMQQLGFGDGEVGDYIYEQSPYEHPVYSAYKELRGDRDFLARVQRGPNYNEAEAPAAIRYANPVEYLYEMLALDSNDPSLCGRISPNAAVGKAGLLRPECYLKIAQNQRNPALCEQVHAFEKTPGAGRHYSPEYCYKSIEGLKQPDSAGFHDEPIFFPRPRFFKEALHQLGDDRDADALAGPSPDDYWEFLQGLAYSHDSNLRAEFLRRVRALKP